MTSWDRARVLALAPDAGARTAAIGLVGAPGWSLVGSSGPVVWGRCQGSGRTPYLTAVVLDEPPAYSCSCPSRKFPCKHALALLLLWSSRQLPEETTLPEYVGDWLQRRADRSAPRESVPRGSGDLADPEAAAKRAAVRAERVAGGLDELDRWLGDQIRGGLAGLERAGYAPFDTIAARMVDAQAPGVAGALRALPGEIAGGSAEGGWPGRLLDQLGLIHLLVEAHRRLDRLPAELAATVRSRVGYPVAKDDVLARPGVSDHWLALGMVETVEYRLETRRVWLYGTTTRRWACLLSFTPPGGTLVSDAVAGDDLQAVLHFYPGSGQFRALVGQRTSVTTPAVYPAAGSLTDVQRQFAALLADDPWATRMPAVVAAAPLAPAAAGRPWRLRDADGTTCPVTGLDSDPWLLVACSAGEPVAVFGEWSSRGFRPLSVLPGDHGTGFASLLGQAA